MLLRLSVRLTEFSVPYRATTGLEQHFQHAANPKKYVDICRQGSPAAKIAAPSSNPSTPQIWSIFLEDRNLMLQRQLTSHHCCTVSVRAYAPRWFQIVIQCPGNFTQAPQWSPIACFTTPGASSQLGTCTVKWHPSTNVFRLPRPAIASFVVPIWCSWTRVYRIYPIQTFSSLNPKNSILGFYRPDYLPLIACWRAPFSNCLVFVGVPYLQHLRAIATPALSCA